MKTARWLVEDGKFRLPSGDGMQASCHHRRKGGACGGCYARLAMALDAIDESPGGALSIVKAVHAAMQAEGKAKKARAR